MNEIREPSSKDIIDHYRHVVVMNEEQREALLSEANDLVSKLPKDSVPLFLLDPDYRYKYLVNLMDNGSFIDQTGGREPLKGHENDRGLAVIRYAVYSLRRSFPSQAA